MATSLDPHGQPYNMHFNRGRRTERDLSELLGLAKGVLADGVVSAQEAELIRVWVENHGDAAARWPINALHDRLARIFQDGRVDEEERTELAELLTALVGGEAGIIGGADAATDLPIDTPPPVIAWPDSVFVFTGKFAFGPRTECERSAARLGGRCESHVTRRTNYLVIGTFGSRDWAQTSFGRKIEAAVRLRMEGHPLAIVSEDYWAGSLT